MATFKKQRTNTIKNIRTMSADNIGLQAAEGGAVIAKRMPLIQAAKLAKLALRGELHSHLVEALNVKDSLDFFTFDTLPFCKCCGPDKCAITWHENNLPVARVDFSFFYGIAPSLLEKKPARK